MKNILKLGRMAFLSSLSLAFVCCSDSDTTADTGNGGSGECKPSDKTQSVEYRKKNSSGFGAWSTVESAQTRTIDDMGCLTNSTVKTDEWGGRTDKTGLVVKVGKSGFFGIGKVANRWYFVDPNSNPVIIHGTQHIAPYAYDQNQCGEKQAAFSLRFGSNASWAAQTAKLLSDNGFNYVSYGAKRIDRFPVEIENTMLNNPSGAKMAQGEILYLLRTFMWDLKQPFEDNLYNRLVLIFEPSFEPYIDLLAKAKCAMFADSPNFLGYYLDNELPFNAYENNNPRLGVELSQFLALPDRYSAAREFATEFLNHRGHSASSYTKADSDDFRDAVADRYFELTTKAVRKYDKNHLILGSRLHDWSKYSQGTIKACAKYCDVISMNYYARWQPEADFLANVRTWSGDKPVFITEFYVKAEDAAYKGAKYENTEGGGWMVRTQKERGKFYQNFCMRLLEARNCVGWTHFMYNDSYGSAAVNSNKGIVSAEYAPYNDFLSYMSQMHKYVYNVADYYGE